MTIFKPIQGENLWSAYKKQNTIYKEYIPCRELQPYVACYWVSITHGNKSKPFISTVIPDGCMDIVLNVKDSFAENCIFITGLMTSPIISTAECLMDFTGIRFWPGGIIPFIKHAAMDFTNQEISLVNIFGPKSAEISEKIYMSTTIEERIIILELLLKDLLRKANDIDPLIKSASYHIYQHQGVVSIRNLSAELYISQRHLSRKFKDWIGINPKTFSDIIRFQNIIRELNNTPDAKLLDLALKYGYYDQAHFTKEFREFYGISPGQL